MKNAKLILLVLLGGLFIGSMGCGGGSGGGGQGETDEVTARLLEKIFTPGPDGSPAVFDYAPAMTSQGVSAATDEQNVHFVKYISSKDLNSDNEFVTTLHLNKDSEYIIKYSHGGRTLNDSLLGLRISAPDGKEMILDLLSADMEVSEDVINDTTPKNPNELSPEELEREKALDEKAKEEEMEAPLYVSTDIEIILEENPCIVLYRFKAPQTGDYQFAVSELTLSDDLGGLVRNTSPDVPFEFRLYGSAEAHSVFDGEGIEISPRDILDIQRILLYSATDFNENGLPVDFEITGDEEGTAENSVRLAFLVLPMNETPPAKKIQEKLKTPYSITGNKVIPPAIIDNVPYDDLFEEGAGFYAHSGLRAVTNVVDDEAFSKNALRKFTPTKPGTGSILGLKETLAVDVIATEEEHDRSAQLAGMSSFVLLRDAFNRSPRRDYARLGSDHARVISVRYELAEEAPRTVDPKEFKLVDGALDALKEKGAESFLKNYGDYFVAGYTWGLRYDATVEITTEPSKSYYSRVLFRYSRGLDDEWDAGRLCDMMSERVKTVLENAKINAISERDTGKSSQDALNKMNTALTSLERDFKNVTLNVSHCKRTGTGGEASLSLRDFASSLGTFIKSARGVNRSQYQQLYVTLRRFREIKDARPYIPEALTVGADLYTAIRSLTEKIFRTRCYYNALMVLPASQLRGGKGLQDGWEQEFEVQLINKVDRGLNYICADKGRVKEYQGKFDKLYKKYKALAERYNFYCYFMRIQKSYAGSSPSWDDSDADQDTYYEKGFSEYTRSSLVLADMKAGGSRYHSHKEPCTSGPGYADFRDNDLGNSRVYWFETGYHDTNHCKGSDQNGKTIGKNSYHWYYKGASSRRLEVSLELKFVDMPADKYPFAGLE